MYTCWFQLATSGKISLRLPKIFQPEIGEASLKVCLSFIWCQFEYTITLFESFLLDSFAHVRLILPGASQALLLFALYRCVLLLIAGFAVSFAVKKKLVPIPLDIGVDSKVYTIPREVTDAQKTHGWAAHWRSS